MTQDKNTLPTGASSSAAEIRRLAELKVIQEYFENVGTRGLCLGCPYYEAEPDVNFFGCRILMGEYPSEYAPCL